MTDTTLADTQPSHAAKILLLGESGSGKTGALACLANAGYELYIADFDNGLDVLRAFTSDEGKKRIHYRTFTDRMAHKGNAILPFGIPTAYTDFLIQMDTWKVETFDTTKVIVIDSLTHMGNCCMRYQLALNKHDTPTPGDWGGAMDLQESVLELLYSTSIKCHVIVISHINWTGGIEEYSQLTMQIGLSQKVMEKQAVSVELPHFNVRQTKGLPSGLGRKLPPKIPTYFNTTLLATTRGMGLSTKRLIRTGSDSLFDLKCPVQLPYELPHESGLLVVLRAIEKLAA